jgi:ankyrin repeat protein
MLALPDGLLCLLPTLQVDLCVGTPCVPEKYQALTGHETALHLAASHTYHFNHTKHTRITRLLLDAGSDPNKRCGSGLTAAHRAARANNLGVLRELLSCERVKWDIKDPEGRTARALAAHLGHKETVELLELAGVKA